MTKPKRRVRSPHRGVKIVRKKRKTGTTFYARFTDPDTEQEKQENLTALGLTNAQARREWCIQKSNTLLLRKAALASGAPRITSTPLKKAVESYLKSCSRLKPKTQETYGNALQHLLRWARRHSIETVEALTPARLVAFHEVVVNTRTKVAQPGTGVGRGANRTSSRPLSPSSVNQILRTTRTFLNRMRRMGCTPKLDSDSILDSMPNLPRTIALPRFLRSREIVDLLDAARRHDADTFKETRKEHAGNGKPGTTPRYEPIFPFIHAALMTGCRFSELAGLRWDEVDLIDGEIRLDYDRVKTSRGRQIPLNICPSLLDYLKQQKLQSNGTEYVFSTEGPFRKNYAESARKRLIREYGAPAFAWHDLRRTCGTFLTNAGGIYGGASAFLSAKRLGHSVAVAELRYVGTVTSIAATAETLEAAMGIEELFLAAKADRQAAS